MLEKNKIKTIRISDTNRDGQPYLDKNQRPFSMAFLTLEDGRKPSGFIYLDSPVHKWQVGGEYQMEIQPSKDGKYLNFRIPYTPNNYVKTGLNTNAQMDRLEAKVEELSGLIEMMVDKMNNSFTEIKPENMGVEIRPESIGF